MKKNYRLSITSILCFATLFAIVFLAFEGCKKEKKEPSPVGITNFSVSECLNNSRIDQWNDTIYVTAIDDSKLKIRTTHTPFNCCSTEFSQEINVQENNITATMLEYGDPCDCICGRSVEFFLNNLEIGKTYTIILKHDNYEYFRFEVTFQTDTNLTFYTNPTPTPAPVPAPIAVSDFSVSDCLDHPQTKDWNDTIYVTAIDDIKLKIRTTHTPFNCCTTEFSQEINVQENDITITMHEDGDFCNCLCGRSMEFVLNNLEIGKTYTVILKHDNHEYFRFEVTFQTDTNLTFYTNPTPTPAPVPAPIAVSDFSVSDCLDHPQTKDWNDTIYVTAIDDSKLKIHTTRTPFNCCTTEFSQEINVQENDITVTMHEDGDFCYCICRRSVEFILNNLEIGKTYTIILKHDNHEYFRFEVTFQPDTQLILVV